MPKHQKRGEWGRLSKKGKDNRSVSFIRANWSLENYFPVVLFCDNDMRVMLWDIVARNRLSFNKENLAHVCFGASSQLKSRISLRLERRFIFPESWIVGWLSCFFEVCSESAWIICILRNSPFFHPTCTAKKNGKERNVSSLFFLWHQVTTATADVHY